MPTPLAPDTDQDLDQVVRDLLEKHRGSWPQIADKAEVSHSWLSKFVNGHIPNPGISTLKKIRDHFKAA
jgi:transcriptional regulator with XRE-family HTH domain